MFANAILRAQATLVQRGAANPYQATAQPNLQKWWEKYEPTRNLRRQYLSPFEVDVVGPLFRNLPNNIKHRITDNIVDVAPPTLFYAAFLYWVKSTRAEIVLHHRA